MSNQTYNAEQDIVFQNDAVSAGAGTALIMDLIPYKDLTIEISGTSSTRTVSFYGVMASGVSRPISGINMNGFALANNTTGTEELWTFGITGLKKVIMYLTAVSGGTVTITGRAVA
jgi:hypothetical protein